MSGPQPFTHHERMARAQEIAAQFRTKLDVLAIGLYGSLARGTDGPYSDIEMYCVVRGEDIDQDYEWSEGAWKAEVNVQSAEVLTAWAAELDEFWPLTHGSCVNILPLYDPERFFESLREDVFDHADEEFDELIQGVIVGELYEFLGKIRNAAASGKTEYLPALTVEMAQYGAYLIGLANRKLYTSAATLFSESLALTDQPSGYENLCQMVASGRLESSAEIVRAADQFWESVEAWAQEKSIPLHTRLEELLK
jgi:kanamycin nucleotidyltransferase